MNGTRILIVATSLVQILVGCGWVLLMTRMQSPSESTKVGVYGLLLVAIVSLVTQFNRFGISFVLFGNYALAAFWGLGMFQNIPDYIDYGFSFTVVLSAGLYLIVILPCLVSARAVTKLSRESTSD